MERDLRIRTALLRLGVDDVLEWAQANCTTSLVDLNKELAAGVAPIDLERFMAAAAKETGRYDEFVRTEAVRRLHEHFPDGLGASNQQDYGFAAGWAMWFSLFEPAHRKTAHAVWDRLRDMMRSNPDWRPEAPDDPVVIAAFSGTSFQPSLQQRRFDDAVRVMEQVAQRGNRRGSHVKSVKNFQGASPGYGFLYGLYAVDGQVCNGGFIQFYQNTGGVPAALAVNAFRAINRDEFASLVEESLQSALRDHPDLLEMSVVAEAKKIPASAGARSLEELDEQYYALSRAPDPDWLETAMIELVTLKPEFFRDTRRE